MHKMFMGGLTFSVCRSVGVENDITGTPCNCRFARRFSVAKHTHSHTTHTHTHTTDI